MREFAQTDVPDFTGLLHSRSQEAYGAPDSVQSRNLYDAQRALSR